VIKLGKYDKGEVILLIIIKFKTSHQNKQIIQSSVHLPST
jgi:hypothetical protein